MTDKELDDYMKTVNPNFDSHIEKGTIEMSDEYYTLLEEKMARLINQNKELNGAIKIYDILLKSNVEENIQLKDNWDYIKKMLKGIKQEEFNINGYCGTCTDIDIDFLLNKMQELEKIDNNE